MAEKNLYKIGEQIKNLISGDFKIEDAGSQIIISGEMNVGVKNFSLIVEVKESIIKVKGSREYSYPLSEAAVDDFNDKVSSKHQECSIYVSGQSLNFSKFSSYESEADAFEFVKKIVAVIEDVVLTFESMCVNFLEKADGEVKPEVEYDPEQNIDIVSVDNSYQVVSMTEKDNDEYINEHNEFAKKVFLDLAKEFEASVNEGSFIVERGNKILSCILSDDEIVVSASIQSPRDVGAMYKSYINAHYSELMCAYKEEGSMFTVRGFASPDKYIPDETKEMLNLCVIAIDACINEYEETITKKDSASFASDVQQILAEQTESLSIKEDQMRAKEEELLKREEMLYQREEELESKIVELSKERESLSFQVEAEKEKLKQKELEMEEKIHEYEEKNTSDILKIKQLADQVAALQNKQSLLGQSDSGSEEEIFRLKSKVKQLTGQKIALEKKLTEKITLRDQQIRDMSDTISLKDREYKKLEDNIEDMVSSQVADKIQKKAAHISELENLVASAGHEITPEELIKYLRKFNPDGIFKKCHSSTAKFVVFNDESLDIRVRFGDTNYVDVSKEARLKDDILRKLNSQNVEIKFFSKEKKIIARKYFKKTSSPEEVDEIIEALSSFFAK